MLRMSDRSFIESSSSSLSVSVPFLQWDPLPWYLITGPSLIDVPVPSITKRISWLCCGRDEVAGRGECDLSLLLLSSSPRGVSSRLIGFLTISPPLNSLLLDPPLAVV